ncbi:MAG: CDP-alcohol phosphatidyltransferase family protein [Balneolaceae bacterium]|nr:CDP-alcohol phosphatidyltransferase family protein [Balneolaceae bacterium]
MLKRLKAWTVHLFTASGIIAVFMALISTAENDFRTAMLWLIAAQLIDGVDGTLARRYNVQKVLPKVSGKSIDFVIDFCGYAVIPAFMIYQAALMQEWVGLSMALLIVFTSAIYYGKTGMITDDFYFKGFPVMWNMAAFYLIFIFNFPDTLNAVLIFLLAVMQFLPIKFAYPSMTSRWKPATLTFTTILMVSMTGMLILYPNYPDFLYWGPIISLDYFAVFGFAATFIFKE